MSDCCEQTQGGFGPFSRILHPSSQTYLGLGRLNVESGAGTLGGHQLVRALVLH